jgi:hypothetical protein
VIVFDTARTVTVSQSSDVRPQSLDTRAVDRLRVFLKVVDEVSGLEEGEPVALDPRIIDDVQGFFQRYRFPNGRYRIYLQEAGRAPRLIIDISIRDGRAVAPEADPAPGGAPPAAAPKAAPGAAPQQVIPAPDAAAGLPAAESDANAGLPASDQAPPAQSPTAVTTKTTPEIAADVPASPTRSTHRWSAAAASLSAGLALAAAAHVCRDGVAEFLTNPRFIPRTRFHRFHLLNSKPAKPPT